MNDPLLLELTPVELMREEMADWIEWELNEREGVTLETLEASHLWPEDQEVNPNGYAALLQAAYERLEDWDAADKEAKRLVAERRGGEA